MPRSGAVDVLRSRHGVSRVWVRELKGFLTWQQLSAAVSTRSSWWPASVTSRNGHSFLRSSRKPSSARPFPAPGAACSSRLSSSTPASVLKLPAPGEAGMALWCHCPRIQDPFLPFGWQSSPRLLPPCPPHHPSAPPALPCPALPPRPPGRTQPGSRARAVSVRPLPARPGMQLDRGGGRRHTAPSRPSTTLKQAGGPGLPGPGLLLEGKPAACP